MASNKRHGRYLRILGVAALLVALAVVVGLMQNGVAMTHTKVVLDCHVAGEVAHTHNADCYDDEGNLVCQLPEREAHVHTDACYEEVRTLACGLGESEGHAHADACYDAEGNLVCELAESEGHHHTDACYEVARELVCDKEELTQEHVHGPGCFVTVTVDEDGQAGEGTGYVAGAGNATAEDDVSYQPHWNDDYDVPVDELTAAVMPEQTFEHTFTQPDEDGNEVPVLTVRATAPAGALPAESTMLAQWVDPAELSPKAQQAVEDAVAEKVEGKITSQQAVDIAFYDAAGNKVEPARKVTVTFVSEMLGTKDKPVVVHVDDLTDEEAEQLDRDLSEGKTIEEAEPDRTAQPVDELSDEALAKRELELGDDELAVASDRFSTYVLNMTSLKHTMRANGETVSITVDAPAAAGIPADAELSVTEIGEAGGYYDYLAQVGEVVPEEEVQLARFFDIKIVDGQGQELQPAEPVQVRIELADAPTDEDTSATVVHFADEGGMDLVAASESEGTTSFDAEGFSVYGVVYTVDFRYEVDGRSFELSIPGGGAMALSDLVRAMGVATNADAEDPVAAFVAQVAGVEFSDPSLVWVGKVEADTTVGELKQAHGLQPQLSAELTADDIAALDAQPLAAGDWALVSLRPFTSEESLVLTMVNGDAITIGVTDAQEVSSSSQIDADKSYVLCYRQGNDYYVLKTDGTTTHITGTPDFDKLGDDYRWAFHYIFTEKDRHDGMDNVYYFIRPVADKADSLALYQAGINLLESGANNIAVDVRDGGGFIFEGYDGQGGNGVYLDFDASAGSLVASTATPPSVIRIYEQEPLQRYDYVVTTADYTQGTVSSSTGTAVTQSVQGSTDTYTYYTPETNDNKTNSGRITTTAVTHTNGELRPGQTGYGQNKWVFDYFDLNGEQVDASLVSVSSDGKTATIAAGALTIPSQGSVLTAHFKQNPNYVVPKSEKEGTPFDDMTSWLTELQNRNIPLNDDGCTKTAEVYDYENRIYRVDLTAQSSLTTFDGTIDLGFVLDVSKSMLFPATMTPYKTDVEIYKINNNSTNKNWLSGNGPYYVIADEEQTATVFRLFKSNGTWYTIDASKYNASNPTSGATALGTGTNATAWIKDPDNNNAVYSDSDAHYFYHRGDTVNAKYTIYTDARTGIDRFDDLTSSMVATVNSMKTLLNLLSVVEEESDPNSAIKDPNVKVAYTTFHGDTPDQNSSMPHNYSFTSATSLASTIQTIMGTVVGSTDGGTSTELAMANAKNFNWDPTASKRYVVLITDGAPQKGGRDIANTLVEANATDMKKGDDETAGTSDDVKLITVGLSMGNVERGKELLYDLADEVNGERAFYSAEGDNLEDVLLHILKTIMDDATVIGQVTDTINEAFYPVDKATGRPLAPGNRIDLEGNQVPDSYAGPVGVVQPDGMTIVWDSQDFTWEGWQGTVYVKAREDFLGANAVRTNDGDASIVAQRYKLREGGTEYPLSATHSNSHYNTTVTRETPLVNVNELNFGQNNTEWTVYIGEQVDPKQELKKLYDSIEVEQVVTAARASDGSELPDLASYVMGRFTQGSDAENSNYYPLLSSISDRRESDVDPDATRSTFLLKDLIRTLADGKGYAWWDDATHDVKIDEFVAAAMTGNGIVIPYDAYGLDYTGHTDGSTLTIKIEKAGVSSENGLTTSPHATTVTGDGVERYTLTVVHTPDYDVTPKGQGGSNTADFHTGIYESTYQGHAAGTETSENVHVINVYAQPLDVVKTDDDEENPTPLAGAKFALYRAAKNGETPVVDGLTDFGEGLTGSYFKLAEAETDENGVAHLVAVADGMTADQLLVPGETYYLVETQAPTVTEETADGGTKEVTFEPSRVARLVTVETEDGTYTDLTGAALSGKLYPFNWDQGARILVDGEPVAVTAIAEAADDAAELGDGQEPAEEPAATTEELTDGSFVSKARAVSFHTTVENVRNEMRIGVEKQWENQSNPPSAISFELYRVAHIDCRHEWGAWEVVTEPDCENTGLRRRTCSRCDETVEETIPALGHDYVATELPASCTEAGTVTYVCTHDASHTYTETVPAKGHVPGEEHMENYVEPDYGVEGGYDLVVRCQVCDEVLSSEHVTLPALVKTTQIRYRVYDYWYNEFWGQRRGYLYLGRNEYTTPETYVVGTTVTITWHDSHNYSTTDTWGGNTPAERAYVGASPSGASNGSSNFYWFGNTPYTRLTRTGGNGNYTYSVTFTVTENMVIDLCLGYFYDSYNASSFVFSGTTATRAQGVRAAALLAAQGAGAATEPVVSGDVGTAGDAGQTGNGGLAAEPAVGPTRDSGSGTQTVLTSAELQTLLESYTNKAELEEGQDNVTYIEKVGDTYTVSADDDWMWSRDDLPRFDEDGNEYTYYVVEVSPSSGYETTYLGQSEGLQDGDTAIIINKLAPITVNIVKVDQTDMETPLPGAEFTLQQLDESGKGTNKDGCSPVTSSLTGSDGTTSFANLTEGYYRITESKVPAGYIITDNGTFYVRIRGGAVSLLVEDRTKPVSEWAVREPATGDKLQLSGTTATVGNEPGAELPAAGGAGTTGLYVLGMALMLLGGSVILRRRRLAQAV